MNNSYFIVSFYKYFSLVDPQKILKFLKLKFLKYRVIGRIYISKEGISAQVSILKIYYYKVIKYVQSIDNNFKKIFINHSINNTGIAFKKLIIKIRKELVSTKLSNSFFLKKNQYLNFIEAEMVNRLYLDPKCIFVDVRNYYEYFIGRFKNSFFSFTFSFRQQIPYLLHILKKYRKKKIVLYCTGGIRCEKFSYFLLQKGFLNVYQIKGGILNYIHQTQERKLKNFFQGKLFVFDDRLSESITKKVYSTCYNCKKKTQENYTNCRNNKCHLLFIQCIFCTKRLHKYCSKKCKNI